MSANIFGISRTEAQKTVNEMKEIVNTNWIQFPQAQGFKPRRKSTQIGPPPLIWITSKCFRCTVEKDVVSVGEHYQRHSTIAFSSIGRFKTVKYE